MLAVLLLEASSLGALLNRALWCDLIQVMLAVREFRKCKRVLLAPASVQQHVLPPPPPPPPQPVQPVRPPPPAPVRRCVYDLQTWVASLSDAIGPTGGEGVPIPELLALIAAYAKPFTATISSCVQMDGIAFPLGGSAFVLGDAPRFFVSRSITSHGAARLSGDSKVPH